MNNRTRPTESFKSSPSGNPETPLFQFRDPKTPSRVCDLARQGIVTLSDLLLLWAVDSLVRPQTADSIGEGCYATNAYLGRTANIEPTYVSKRIKYLREIGLLLVVDMHGRRYLEAEWSRTAEERAAVPGLYGRLLRSEHRDLLKRLGAGRGGCTKLQPPCTEHQGGVVQNCKQNINLCETEETHCCGLPAGNKEPTPKARPKAGKRPVAAKPAEPPPLIPGETPEVPPPVKLARRLYEVLKQHGVLRLRYDERRWAREFAALLAEGVPPRRAFAVLRWYADNYRDQFTPKKHCARTFCDAFSKYEEAMARREEEASRELSRKDGKAYRKDDNLLPLDQRW